MTIERITAELTRLNLKPEAVEVDSEGITVVKITDRVSVCFKGEVVQMQRICESLDDPRYTFGKPVYIDKGTWPADLTKQLAAAEREEAIHAAILATVTDQPTFWTTISAAVGKAVKVRSNGWNEVRNALQVLLNAKKIYKCCVSMDTVHLADHFTTTPTVDEDDE
jgi:ABC-type methionine transport system ATPase subunit